MAIHGDPIQASGQPNLSDLYLPRQVILYSLCFCVSWCSVLFFVRVGGGGPAGPEGVTNSAATGIHVDAHAGGWIAIPHQGAEDLGAYVTPLGVSV